MDVSEGSLEYWETLKGTEAKAQDGLTHVSPMFHLYTP